jgi:NAD(P)-dependent dehydrogenase (short-subunit alcohol dehydrogenase family)
MGELSGRKALVTGASKPSGIGYALALKLAEAGADVAVADLVTGLENVSGYVSTGSNPELEALAREIQKRGVKALAVPLDVTDPASITDLAEKVKAGFGALDVLVNNAGVGFGPALVVSMDEQVWRKTLDINLNGPFRVVRALAPLLRPGASIINMSSRAGKVASPFMAAYCVSKAGLIMLTKVMALEFGNQGIRVNAVCPGQIETELGRWGWKLKAFALRKTLEEYEKELAAAIPLKRLGQPQDVAEVVLFLASDRSAYLTGQALNVTGGQLMEL